MEAGNITTTYNPGAVRTEKMTEQQFKAISDWQNKTFGEATPISKLAHLLQEVVELKEALVKFGHEPSMKTFDEAKMEYADCFFLLFGSAASFGLSHSDICRAIQEKFEINKARKWGKPNKEGVVEHIKD